MKMKPLFKMFFKVEVLVYTHVLFQELRQKFLELHLVLYDCLFKLLKQHTHNTVVEMVEAQCHLQRYVIVSATSNVKYAKKISYYSYTFPPFFFYCLVIL